MKKRASFLLCLMLTLAFALAGQDTLSPEKLNRKFVLKTNPLLFGTLNLNVHTEIPFLSKNAITLAFMGWPVLVPPFGFTGHLYGSAALGYRRYYKLKERSLFFYEGFGRFNLIHNFKDIYSPGGVGSYSLGLVWGKQWEFRKKAVFEFFVGPYYSKSFPLGFEMRNADTRTVSYKTVKEYGPFNGIWLRAGIAVGKRF